MKKIMFIIISIFILLISCASPSQDDAKERLTKDLVIYIEQLKSTLKENPNILNEPCPEKEKMQSSKWFKGTKIETLSDQLFEHIEKITEIVNENKESETSSLLDTLHSLSKKNNKEGDF